MIEAVSGQSSGEGCPMTVCSLEQRQRSHDIGTRKHKGICYGAIYVALGSKVYDTVYSILLHDGTHSGKVADVGVLEGIIRPVGDIGNVGRIAGISESVNIEYARAGIFVHQQPHNVAAYKSGATRNHYRFGHNA